MPEEFVKEIEELHKRGLHLECGFGCSNLEFICSGEPEKNPYCSYCITCDKDGNEVEM